MAMLSSYLSYNNLRIYLSWFTRSAPFKKLHEHKLSAGKRKQIENCKDDQITGRHGSGGCWQSPPQDVMEAILQKMGLIARTRLAEVCISWRSLAMRTDIRGAPQPPWLVHPQAPNTNYLTFSSLSEGEVVNLELPNPKRFREQGKFEFLASSRGWLIILREDGHLSLDMFLYNPISRVQHQLPSLNTKFVTKVVLSSPNISECIVAAVIDPQKELALCRPGQKTWTVFEILNDDKDDLLVDLLFSRGILYGLVHLDANGLNNTNGIGAARVLNFGDDQTMTVGLKLVYAHEEVIGNTKEEHNDYLLYINGDFNSYLVESTTNADKEILLVHQMLDCLIDCGDDDNEWDIEYQRTSGFVVYKIDLESGKFHEVKNLGDQIIFLAEHSSSLSIVANNFNLNGNCIYFATSGYDLTDRPLDTPKLGRYISREIGIFSLDDGKINRPFPSLDVGISSTCKLSWFSPSF